MYITHLCNPIRLQTTENFLTLKNGVVQEMGGQQQNYLPLSLQDMI